MLPDCFLNSLHEIPAQVRLLPLPERLWLPLIEIDGEPLLLQTKVGEDVVTGQCLALSARYPICALTAPADGRIYAIREHAVLHPSGLLAPCIELEVTGRELTAACPPLPENLWHNTKYLHQQLGRTGILSLPGTGAKLLNLISGDTPSRLDTLIINALDTEPGSMRRILLLQQYRHRILDAIHVFLAIFQVSSVYLVMAESALHILAEWARLVAHDPAIHITPMPPVYPRDHPDLLLRDLHRMKFFIPKATHQSARLLLDIEEVLRIRQAIRAGEPVLTHLVEMIGITKPAVYAVTPGTALHHLFTSSGSPSPQKLQIGGRGSGFFQSDYSAPINLWYNRLWIPPTNEPDKATSECTRCKACIRCCPQGLDPLTLLINIRAQDWVRAQENHLSACIECGCCDLVCESHIPLLAYIRHAKDEWREQQSSIARRRCAQLRFQARQKRLVQETKPKALRQYPINSLLGKGKSYPTTVADPRKAAIRSALERVRARKAHIKKKPPEEGK